MVNAAVDAVHVARKVIQIRGGNGCINEYSIGRPLRAVKPYETGSGINEIRHMPIGLERFHGKV